MTLNGKYILAGITAAAVGLVAAGAMAERGHYWEGHKKGRHVGGYERSGLLGLGFGGPNPRVCFGESTEFTDIMLVKLEHRVKPTDDQKGVFEEFKTATRAASEKLREGCPKKPEATEGAAEQPKRTPIDRLAFTQERIEKSLEALKTYRPAAEKFYASLSDEQKASLSERRGKGKWGGRWKRDRGGDQQGEPGGPAPEQPQNEGPAPDDKG